MQDHIAGFPAVRLVPGRVNRIAKAAVSFTALVAVMAIAACSGDSSTGPSSDAGIKAGKKTTPAADTASATAPTNGTVDTASTAGGTATPSAPAPSVADNVLWVNPSNPAKTQATAWRASRPADASQMDKLAARATASWFGDWNTDIYADVNSVVTAAAKDSRVPVLVAYNIPSRDCGGLSGGGGANAAAYRTWISSFASGIAGRRSIVIVEPDALAGMDCLATADQQTRVDLISYAVQVLKSQPNVMVYLDAGNPSWHTPADIAARLVRASIGAADGFSLNISNFFTTAENVTYGQKVSAMVSGKHFIVDTSRNGLGPTTDSQWCNPDGRAVGASPTTTTGNLLVDAYLWVKVPGESDGACNGGPSAGKWWGDYALGLVNRSTL